MAKEKDTEECCEGGCCPTTKQGVGHGTVGGMYGLAFVGAAVYFIGQADGFWMGVLGFLKAVVWPALLIYKVFAMIGM